MCKFRFRLLQCIDRRSIEHSYAVLQLCPPTQLYLRYRTLGKCTGHRFIAVVYAHAYMYNDYHSGSEPGWKFSPRGNFIVSEWIGTAPIGSLLPFPRRHWRGLLAILTKSIAIAIAIAIAILGEKYWNIASNTEYDKHRNTSAILVLIL